MLNLLETEKAIKFTKDIFEQILAKKLKLTRVSAPLFVYKESGLNDDLSGKESPVNFYVPSLERNVEIEHSLAKWKRNALLRYNFKMHEGLYTDMNAIRKDENLDNIHSIYVDQWDWEKIILRENRTEEYLRNVVQLIVDAVVETSNVIKQKYPSIAVNLSKNTFFISSEELRKMYPNKTPKEREYLICKEHKTVFVSQIGKILEDGSIHDKRSPDYDDWDLNGDILFYDEFLDIPFEISSMGIRVDAESLDKQLNIQGCQSRKQLDYHQMVLNDQLPLTIGGGIGQSRLSMLLLEKAHIGEVQSSIWDKETLELCQKANIKLL